MNAEHKYGSAARTLLCSAFVFFILAMGTSCCQNTEMSILTGAQQTERYFDACRNKNVAVVANATSIIDDSSLVDSLMSAGINLKRIFCPEHGFRGEASAGAVIADGRDVKTGIEIISLYGNNKKPGRKYLEDVDLLLFDLQDVGVRFYTYISTLTLVMEACAEADVKMIVLDRPNPNACYVDGPVLEPGFESFVGMHHVPVVYGMTIGEYALMVNGEGWINPKFGKEEDLTVVTLKNYSHDSEYDLPVNPSPNLQNMNAIYLYPSLCFFEGTCVSVGRGTDSPFELYGHPDLKHGDVTFIPHKIPGVADNPKLEGVECRGVSLAGRGFNMRYKLDLSMLVQCYNELKDDDSFFIPFFDKLAGTDKLRKSIVAGETADAIRQSWQKDVENFKLIREKYLLYN
ncbi:MAG: DUF1343 domain-containing protein [Bacteroidales bacterium]|nr:DUF1343 domain-containing protein [Bacteroidales bacterium]